MGSSKSREKTQQIDTITGSSEAIKSASDEERGSGGNSAAAKQSKRYMSSNSVLANTVKTKPVMNLKWNRVVFKISGAALSGDCQSRDTELKFYYFHQCGLWKDDDADC